MLTTAYVLAAGLGTRLRPLTSVRCKPLVEVCGTPLIHFALRLLERAGVRRVGINSHWLHPQLPEALGARFGHLELRYTHEPVVLGTGGGLRALTRVLPPPPGERVLVLNADTLIDLDMRAFLSSPDALATLVLKATPDAAAYGAIGTDDTDRIVAFADRFKPLGPATRERMFCGVHLVHPRAFTVLPDVDVAADGTATGAVSGIWNEGYPVWLGRGETLRAFDTAGTFCDVGTPERLWEANMRVLDGTWPVEHLRPFHGLEERPGRVFVARDAVVHSTARLVGPALVAAGARVAAGAVVEGSVVGPGVDVGKGARVAHSVLQSGARVAGEVTRAIVWPEGRLEVAAVAADLAESGLSE